MKKSIKSNQKRPKRCPSCNGNKIHKHGLSNNKMRWKCTSCNKTFVRKRKDQRDKQRFKIFLKWVDGFTIDDLSKIHYKSEATIKRIIYYFLRKDVTWGVDLNKYKYLVFDGKYLFGREYCLITLLDAMTNIPIAAKIVKSESRKYIEPWLRQLKKDGLEPISVTTDGKPTVIKAFKMVYPNIITQRCLVHIQRQIKSWVRIPPKTEPGKDLSLLINKLPYINTIKQKSLFIQEYNGLISKHKNYFIDLSKKLTINNYRDNIQYNKDFKFNKEVYDPIKDALRIKTSTEKDLDKAYKLVKTAYSEMFHYLRDKNIAKTTNSIEGYFKKIQKIKGFDHCGLVEEHLFKLIEYKVVYDFNKKVSKKPNKK